MNRSTQSADPRCWWCGAKTEPETGWRGDTPELNLPPGSAAIVCGPGCPKRPAGVAVTRRRETATA